MVSGADQGAAMLWDVELPERYRLVRRVASGGMASVWCAEDRLLRRRVAIKLLCETLAGDDFAVRRFKREARAAARLSGHPHVVTIYDVGQTGASDVAPADCAFMVMEYLAGGTVADALRVGAVTRQVALRWLSEAACALDFAHRSGVIHRDVKLANFLLDCNRVLRVGDFGIARMGSEDTITGSGELLGTAAYLAPERVLGEPATEASDIYALAVAAFELLVGERPFTARHYAALARQHLDEEPPRASSRNPELPAAADGVIARGLAKRPEDRWPTAGDFAAALQSAITNARARRPMPLGITARRAAMKTAAFRP